MKGKDLNTFVRFGGVNPKKQKGYKPEPDTYHSPPATRGFYAMPKIAQEFFLISSMGRYQPSTVPKEVEYDENRTIEESEKLWDDYNKRRKKAISSMRKEFIKMDGNIWHHLRDHVKPNEVIDRHGSWVKTDIKSWQKAFTKRSLKYRYGERDDFGGTVSINEPARSGLFGVYSRDEFEVFFDEKV